MSGGTTNSTTETSLSCMPDAEDRYYIPEGQMWEKQKPPQIMAASFGELLLAISGS